MAQRPSDVGELLLSLELLSRDQLQRAVAEARRSGQRLVPTIAKLRYIDSWALAKLVGKYFRVPLIDLGKVVIDGRALASVPVEVCRRLRVLPVRLRGETLVVAMDDPSDSQALDELCSITKLHPEPVVTSTSLLDAALRDDAD